MVLLSLVGIGLVERACRCAAPYRFKIINSIGSTNFEAERRTLVLSINSGSYGVSAGSLGPGVAPDKTRVGFDRESAS